MGCGDVEMTNLKSVAPLDPHAIISTCPRCTRQKIIGYVYPQYMHSVGLCDMCARDKRIERLFRRMIRMAAVFAGVRPFAGYVEWTLLKNQRFISPLDA